MNSLGIYIHVPFCVKKCNYCDFFSIPQTKEAMDKYTDGVIKFIENCDKTLKARYVDTVYFGGGTPSLLENERIIRIINTLKNEFNIAADAEITLEANPSTTDNIDFEELRLNGVNRISLGMQSIHDDELKCLGRVHKHVDVIHTLDKIRNAGITNISLDVMLGIPLQTKNSLKNTLDFCIMQDINHISTYMLKIEEGTPFFTNRERYVFADEDTQASFYEFTSEHLSKHGYRHYEISNFCKDNKISNHNMKYWELNDYLGIGPSSHSMINGERFYIPSDFEDFYNGMFISDGKGKTAEEYLMLSLRTDKGFVFSDYEKLFNKTVPDILVKEANFLEKYGLVTADDYGIKLTEKGFLVSNTIISDLLNKGI